MADVKKIKELVDQKADKFVGVADQVWSTPELGFKETKSAAALIAALESIEGVRISGSGGGIHFLLTNPRFSESELLRRAAEQGIALRGLSSFCRGCAPEPSTLVVGYGGLEDGKISRAAERLSLAWK